MSSSGICGDGSSMAMSVVVDGKIRAGPSFCMQDALFDPFVLSLLGLLAAMRAKQLMGLPGGNSRPELGPLIQKIQFVLVALGIIKALVNLVQAGATSQVRETK
jgi:hypothetical protein